jgi:hypothetical protein
MIEHPSDTGSVADKVLRVLGAGDPANRRPVEWSHRDLGTAVFLVLLPVVALGATVALHWEAVIFWAFWIVLMAKAVRWWRGRRPQEAWLEGSVLSVRRGGSVERCDLATATVADLVTSVFAEPGPSFSVLRVGEKGAVLRYVLKSSDDRALPAEDLRVLAEAFTSGPRASKAAVDVAARLREIAQYGHERPWSERIDWSHRARRPD